MKFNIPRYRRGCEYPRLMLKDYGSLAHVAVPLIKIRVRLWSSYGIARGCDSQESHLVGVMPLHSRDVLRLLSQRGTSGYEPDSLDRFSIRKHSIVKLDG